MSSNNSREKEIVLLSKKINVNPRNPNVYYKRGCLYMNIGDFEKMIADFIKAIELKPSLLDKINSMIAIINFEAPYSDDWKLRNVITYLFDMIKLKPSLLDKISSIITNIHFDGEIAYVYNEFFDDIIEHLDKVCKSIPGIVDEINLIIANICYNRGVALYCAKHYIQAIDVFTEAISYNKKFAKAFYYRELASLECEDNNYSENPIIDFLQAIGYDANFAIRLYNSPEILGRYKLPDLIEYCSKISRYTELIQNDPLNSQLYYLRGNTYLSWDADTRETLPAYITSWYVYEPAIKDYTKAIELNPKLDKAFKNRADAYFLKNDIDRITDIDKIITDYRRAIKLNPKIASEINSKLSIAYEIRGDAYFDRSNYAHAISDYTNVIRLNPRAAYAMVNMGIAYKMKRKRKKAKYWLEKAMKYIKRFEDNGDRLKKELEDLKIWTTPSPFAIRIGR